MLHINQNVHSDTFFSDIIKIVKVVRPQWKDKELTVDDKFAMGYLNRNAVVSAVGDEENHVFTRVFNPALTYYIRNSRVLYEFVHKTRLSAPILCTFENGACMEYVRGLPITWKTQNQFYIPEIQRAVAWEAARYHSKPVLDEARRSGVVEGIQWHDPIWQRHIFQQVAASDSIDKSVIDLMPSFEDVMTEIKAMTSILDYFDASLTFCHGDINPSNVIYNQEEDRATFIDYDSLCIAHSVFDISIHFSTFGEPFDTSVVVYPTLEYRTTWLRHYLRRLYDLNGEDERVVTDEDLQTLHRQIQIADLLVQLHITTCYYAIASIFAQTEMDRSQMIRNGCRRWQNYLDKKTNVLAEYGFP